LKKKNRKEGCPIQAVTRGGNSLGDGNPEKEGVKETRRKCAKKASRKKGGPFSCDKKEKNPRLSVIR